MIIKDFNIQLYSVRQEVWRKGLPHVLWRLGKIGYTGVEFAGYGDLPVDEVISMLKEHGLKSAGTHVGLDTLEWAFEHEMAYNKALGTELIIVPSAPFSNPEEVRQTAKRLNALAPKVKAHGFRFAFHNHGVEFERDGANYRIEDMMELCPEVDIQLDVFWASKMGCDCNAFVKKHAPRVISLHIKQYDESGESADLGDGVLDFKSIIQNGLDCGIGNFVHEQEDFSGCMFEGLANGYKHIMSL
jgi:sugar phosphate isomerase/epimerase